MLIQCVECGNSVFDKAELSPNCGCPAELMDHENVCCANGAFYDLTEIFKILPEVCNRRKNDALAHLYPLVLEYTNLDMISANKLAKILYETKKIPESFGEVRFNMLSPNKKSPEQL